MEEKQRMYAHIILSKCLKVQPGQPLLITGEYEHYEYIRLIASEAVKLGVTDIHFNLADVYLKKTILENYTLEQIKAHPFFTKKVYGEYAKKDAAFLELNTVHPGLENKIESNKLMEVYKHILESLELFNERKDKLEIAWCFAATPSIDWAKKVFPNDEKPVDTLWETLFDITGINSVNPIELFNNTLNERELIRKKLNDLKIRLLHFKNKKGTDLKMELFDKSLWCGGITTLKDGRKISVNYPSIEVFTSPNKYTVNGTVHSTKPLILNGRIIEDFSLEFKNGKVIKINAGNNFDLLSKYIESQVGANYLGEVALVPYDSPIGNKNILFYSNLLDENTACHLAIGKSFSKCYENGNNMSVEERDNLGLNHSKVHTDFMFGSEDLELEVTTHDNKKLLIMKNGNYTNMIKD